LFHVIALGALGIQCAGTIFAYRGTYGVYRCLALLIGSAFVGAGAYGHFLAFNGNEVWVACGTALVGVLTGIYCLAYVFSHWAQGK
jgi:hypothetical protein